MDIATIAFADARKTGIIVTETTGRRHSVPWPCRTWHAGVIKGWREDGGVIEEYSPPSVDYRDARAAEYPPVGDTLDALMKWVITVRMAQSAVADATTIAGIRAAIAPVFDLPQDLDDIVGQYTAVKAKHPKP